MAKKRGLAEKGKREEAPIDQSGWSTKKKQKKAIRDASNIRSKGMKGSK